MTAFPVSGHYGVWLNGIVCVYAVAAVGAACIRRKRGMRVIGAAASQRERLIKRVESDGLPPDIRIVLLLPLLREQTEAAALLSWICGMEFPPHRILVVPVTTERESAERRTLVASARNLAADRAEGRHGLRLIRRHMGTFPIAFLRAVTAMSAERGQQAIAAYAGGSTTETVVRSLLYECSYRFPILHVHYPHEDGNKASQMNYALNVLTQRGLLKADRHTYVGVYDADSRPPRATLMALAVAAQDDPAPAFQQYPVYVRGQPPPSRYMLNEAWLQTARSVCVEYPAQLAVNRCLERGRTTGRTFSYCIGHGEFLRADWLLRAFFPEEPPIDDLPTGIMLTLARQRIVPLPFFDFCTVPGDLFQFFRQTATWFAGQSDFAGPLRRARRYFGTVPRHRFLRCALEQAIANGLWIMTGPFRIAILATTLFWGSWVGAGGLVCVWLVESRLLWPVTQRLIESHAPEVPVFTVRFQWTAILRNVLKSAGPCLWVASRLRGWNIAAKTDRWNP